MTIELLEQLVRVGVSVLIVVVSPFRIGLLAFSIESFFLELRVNKGVGILEACFVLDRGLIKKLFLLSRQVFLFLNIDLVLIGRGVLCDTLTLA